MTTPAPAVGARRPPACRLQTRLWFYSRLYPELPFFMVPVLLRLSGDVDPDGIRAALTALTQRHRTLRTCLVPGDDGPEQEVHEEPLHLVVTDLSTAVDPEGAWAGLLSQELARPLDLERGPLIRGHLARTGPGEHRLGLFVHHVSVDAASLETLLDEFAQLYGAWEHSRSLDGALGPAPQSYEDFGQWLEETSAQPAHEKSRAHWRAELGGLPDFDPPTDRPRPAHRTFEVHEERTEIPTQLADEVREFARGQRLTPFVVLASVLAVQLGRRSGPVRDVAIATPWSLRHGSWLQGTVGFFVNTVVLRVRMSSASTFRDVLKTTRGAFFDAMDHHTVPFDEVVALANPVRDPGRLPLTSVCFQVLDQPDPVLALGSVRAEREVDKESASEFDLVWDVIDPGAGPMIISAKYTTDVYDGATIRRMSQEYVRLAASALAGPRSPILDLPLYAEEERAALLARGADHDRPMGHPGDADPLPNGPLYLLDEALRPTPVGAVGQVYVPEPGGTGTESGAGLVPDTVTGREGAWLRPTGLLARWRADGIAEHYDRSPARLSGEAIAARLTALDMVSAALIAPAPGSGGAVAFVATPDEALTPEALRAFLVGHVPVSDIPVWFVLLDALPTDDAGEVDRAVLDEIAVEAGVGFADSETGTELEETVRGVWQECLGRQVPSLDIAFFDVDGHSLTAVRIAARLQSLLERAVPVRAVFDRPTIRSLAMWLADPSTESGPHRTEPAGSTAARRADLAEHLEGASDEELAALRKLTGYTTDPAKDSQ
ncbi:condensation domain-containing protein [Streptomyces sviceus]|uniref:condensation domain-containing protein n=1 Tax=Streptomyces sviceus TaxID=285530 RepID=UPI0036B79CAE